MNIHYVPIGDTCLSIEFPNEISPEVNAMIRTMAKVLNDVDEIQEIVPTYRTILVQYDALRISYGEMVAKLKELEQSALTGSSEEARIIKIPTVYGGEYGEDLGNVCEHNKLSEEEVISIHSSTDYLLYMLGFTPGFPYLGGMSEKIATPRLKSPRTAIPAGSVGIAGSQTGIYPIQSPGGWQLIGRTPLRLYDPHSDQPFLLQAGDYLRFVPISEERFKEIEKEVADGSYRPEIEVKNA